MHQKREVRRSPENYRRTPTKGNTIVSVLEFGRDMAIALALIFAAPMAELIAGWVCGC